METTKLFFELIRCAIKGDELSSQAVECLSNEQLISLFALAKEHDVVPMISYALCKNKLVQNNGEIYQNFINEQNFAVLRYENINYELNRISTLFEEHQIYNIPLKGSVIRSLYPEPWMRTSCDIDILIKEQDKDKVISLLTKDLNCVLGKTFDYEISFYTTSRVHLEIHLNLVAERQDEVIDKVLSEVWNTANVAQGYNYRMEMSDEYLYFYHVAHASKHFCASGCGIRPFVDWWLLDNKKENNQEKRNALLQRGKLLKFSEKARKMISVWFDAKNHDQITSEMEDYILKSGVYGLAENWAYYNQHRAGGKLRYALSKIFLSYDQLKRQYPVLEKHKWLTPFYEIRRWCRLIFLGGGARSMKKINSVCTEQVENRKNMMKSLGLWE